MLSKYRDCTRLLKIKNKLKIGCFYNKSQKELSIYVGLFFFYETIIPLAFFGYEMIIANSYPTRTRAVIVKERVSYNGTPYFSLSLLRTRS